MGFLANRRIAAWTEGLKRWAVAESKRLGPDDPESDFCLGVIQAVMTAQRYGPPLSDAELTKLPLQHMQGYVCARGLINNVLQFGDAPTGDYRTLLEQPFSEPLR